VVIGPSTDKGLLHAALQEMGLNPVETGAYINFRGGTYNHRTNTLTLEGANVDKRTAEMKRAYSAAVVVSQAKKYNWQIKAGKEKFQYVISKRTI
jgi:hypothetical protein